MSVIAENRRARHEYGFVETLEAGIELLGSEVKSLTSRGVDLSGAYAVVRGGEAWLLNVSIPPYQPKNAPADYDASRARRLLLRREELRHLVGRTSEKGLTLVPIKLYSKGGKIKILVGVGKAKKKADKRETLKKREAEREIQRGK